MESYHKEIKLEDIDDAFAEAKSEGKSVFLFDKTGIAETFFKYRSANYTILYCAPLQIQRTMGMKKFDDIKEEYRLANKRAMRYGKNCIFSFDKVVPDLYEEYFEDTGFPQCVF
jgi:hypothetical protein